MTIEKHTVKQFKSRIIRRCIAKLLAPQLSSSHHSPRYRHVAGLLALSVSLGVSAEPLDTKLPAPQEEGYLVILEVNLPAQPLAMSLKQFANQAGLSLAFDSSLAENKMAPAIQGRMTRKEALRRLLHGSGLNVDLTGSTAIISKQAAEEKNAQIMLDSVNVRAKRFYEIGPLPGLGLTKEEIPGNVQSISAEEIKAANSISLADLFNRKLQSVNVNDYQGNPFQMDITYRGFTAGPQIGTPQGLSVFFDGIRVNEPFGDVVNWDMIPMNALASVDVFPGSNPIFGLNTLGGAFTVKTKDGFNHEGFDANILKGAYGRNQLQTEAGWNNGTIGLFGAGNFFMEDGWREDSPSKVNQFFGKASYRGDKLDLNLSTLLVKNKLVGNGLLPSEMYDQDRNSVFTSPDTTRNDLSQFQLSGSYFVNDNFTVTGQVYRRNSKRHQQGADAFTGFANQPDLPYARRSGSENEEYTCLADSHNSYGIPDYFVYSVENPTDPLDGFFGGFMGSGITDPNDPAIAAYANPDPDNFNGVLTKNKELPAGFLNGLQSTYKLISNLNNQYYRQGPDETVVSGPATDYSLGEGEFIVSPGGIHNDGIPNSQINVFGGLDTFYYTQENGVVKKNYFMWVAPKNNESCKVLQFADAAGSDPAGAFSYLDDKGRFVTVDGSYYNGPGIVQGTPTAIFTDNRIDQTTNGASFQLNWNFEKHKLMVGASIDAAEASYSNYQQLGLLDANRHAYLAPDLIHPVYTAADIAIANNNFDGTQTTKSLYFSETWKPVKNWAFTAAARYNETQTKNTVATRFGPNSFEIGEVYSLPNSIAICPNGDCTGVSTSYQNPDLSNILDPAETEKFSYYSLNPSLGTTWQANPALNIYANVAQGTRTPSVIELGCAFDRTPINTGTPDNPNFIPKSIFENRSCTLPTALSGDPYLPQIKATTYDLGMRGTIGDKIRWNLGAYQTDLKDDIYFVARQNNSGFFDSIGDTRRRGIEAGITGESGRFRYGVNYALTDATFQNNFQMYSLDNSSAIDVPGLGGGVINVEKNDKLPGVPLHNLNANIGYDLTDKWNVGLSAVLHSESFVRGNENNEHQQGVSRTVTYIENVNGTPTQLTRVLPPTTNPGKVPGFAVFNLQSSYRLNNEWTASVLVNNLFDREYFTAGRLGRNPFSPSIIGAIGPDGYNHNSDDWRSTNFIAPGAPRGLWFTLRYSFKPDKN